MFVETIVLPRPEWERWHERLRYTTDPPDALAATVELYEDLGKPLPPDVRVDPGARAIEFQGVIARA